MRPNGLALGLHLGELLLGEASGKDDGSCDDKGDCHTDDSPDGVHLATLQVVGEDQEVGDPKKLSGVYKHRVMNRKEPLVRGFDDVFMAPHSRYTQASRQQILDNPRLKVLADSDEAGIYIVLGDGGKEIFVMGHPEYDRLTLDQEYKRDIDKGIEPDLPVNYYPDDDCNRKPLLSWRSHANNLYTNWLNYYVYQITPYDLNEGYDNYCI